MYLRPRSIFEKFLVEEKLTRINEIGRQVVEYKPTGEELFGVVSSAAPLEIERWKQLSHDVTHTIVQKLGRIHAKVGDRLVKEDKIYLVEAIDNPAGLGQWYIYFVKERADVK